MSKLLHLSALLSLLTYVSTTPIHTNTAPTPSVFNLPTSYAALGDSFSAGLGSGFFLNKSADGSDIVCARQDGSYPTQLLELNPFVDDHPSFEFTACSGDVLDDIDSQVAKLSGKKFDLITLTIGGNDFGFSNTAEACVYPTLAGGIKDFQGICDAAFDEGFAQVANQSNWEKYAQKLSIIKNELLNPGGRIFITGYPKFFAEPEHGDACDSISFFPIPELAALNMTAGNRLRGNDLTVQINNGIENVICANGGPDVEFVDFDRLLEGKRFCEPANTEDPIGANNPNVLFNDITTVLAVPGIAEVEKQTPGLTGVDITNKLQQSSVFHPKAAAHRLLAAELNFRILLECFVEGY